jgi:ribosomal protein S12 methylthiotransferase
MAAIPQVCRYLDLPIQHSHPDILKAMGRAESAEAAGRMAARIRRVLPDAALRTTCLVGFPGETDGQFEHLLAFVRETEFDHLGAFAFSPEEGTPAFRMSNRPSREKAEARRERLMLVQQEIVSRKSAKLVGMKDDILLERKTERKNMWSGRSCRQAPEVDGEVFVKDAPPNSQPANFVRVRYTTAAGYDMKATVIQE